MKIILKLNLNLAYILITLFSVAGCASIGANYTQLHGQAAVNLKDDGWISKKSFYEKTVYYGTTRQDRCSGLTNNICEDYRTRLDTGNELTLSRIKYGEVKVKIPYVKEVGSTSGMSIADLQHDIGMSSFMSKLTEDDLLVFIHGFGTPFSSAAIRCAQLSHDTSFKGDAVLFSWPAGDNPLQYATEKLRAKENFKHLADFLHRLALSENKKIHIVAHSMGTYILTKALSILDERIKNRNILLARRNMNDGKVFNQIILASPDIAKDSYYKDFTQHNFKSIAERITMYAALQDHVLDYSRFFNYWGAEGTAQERLGDSSASFFIIDGMDTIDARQEISHHFFGHSFYAKNRSLVTDIYLLLNTGYHPDRRMLQKVIDPKNGNKKLWFIRD